MSSPAGQIAVKAGPVAVAVAGASTAALGTATIIVAAGATEAVAAVGFGAYQLLRSKSRSAKTIDQQNDSNLPDRQ